jgi:hypothetical protein
MLSRAYAAYFKYSEGDQDQPSESLSGETVYRDKRYVVLRNGYRMLAVYRIRYDGMLKRLRRWPAGLEEF